LEEDYSFEEKMEFFQNIFILFLILLPFNNIFAEQPPKQRWVTSYSGTGNGYDEAMDIVIDKSGNVFVTGVSYGEGSLSDYLTIKYDKNGNKLWESRYNGPGNSYDEPYDMEIDNSDNIYLTGSSYGDGTGPDFATIKYDPNGNLLWEARYNEWYPFGSGYDSTLDYAVSLAVNKEGYIYVTGYSQEMGFQRHYVTIKYDPNGNEQWAELYYGPLPRGTGEARKIAVDDFGNAYVTGVCGSQIINEQGYEYATVKYDPNGNKLFEGLYQYPHEQSSFGSGPTGLVVDKQGCVYVTGFRQQIPGDGNSITVKYDSNGNALWDIMSEPNLSFLAFDLHVDNIGNVYVAGSSFADSFNTDYMIIKYDPNGNTIWVACYDGTGSSYYQLLDLAIDEFGNTYATGFSYEYDNPSDFATVKFDPNGAEVWEVRYNSQDNRADGANCIAVNDSGDVYVTGYSDDSNDQRDFTTIRYTQHNYCMESMIMDLNEDCKVNFIDLAYLSEDWLISSNFEDLAKLCNDWLNCNFALEEDCW